MASAPTRPLEVPPYHLQLLVDSVLDDFADIINASSDPRNPPTTVRCAQALGKDLYVGCANGLLIRFALQDHPHRSQPAGYRLVSQYMMPGNKPVDEIALAPGVGKMLVQTDQKLFFFVYPGMEPVPTALINPIRMVVTFAMDEGPVDVHPPTVRFSVVKRTGVAMYTLRERLFYEKDFPIQGIRMLRRYGQHLCIANAERVYCGINIETGTMLEMLPSSQDPTTVVRPSITVIGQNEFLIVSWMGAGAVGVFMTGDADPVRGTLQWQQYPESICIDFPYIIALLPNKSIEIHSLTTMEIVHVVTPPIPAPVFLEPRLLVSSAGLSVPSSQRIEKLTPLPVPVLPPPPPPSPKEKGENEPRGSGLTPPPTPRKLDDGAGGADTSKAPAHARSGVLVLGPNGVQTLVPTTLITQAESLLEANRIEDAIVLAEQTRNRLKMNASGVEDDTAEELRYVYQRIGYLCLLATRFEEAGNYLFRGELDARLLLRHFPDLNPSPLLVPPDATADVYAGIADQLNALGSVDEIIAANLVRNYSPHLEMDDSAVVKLSHVLKENARTMLQTFLRKARNKRMFDSTSNRDVSKVVDTTLLRLLAENEGTDVQDMIALVQESDETIVLPDVEPVLVEHKRYIILANIYERRRETGKLLDLLATLVQDKWTSAEMPDPMARLLYVLDQISDPTLLQKWGLWLVKRDATRGINVLMASRDKRALPKKYVENADLTLLKQIREASAEAGDQFLEYLVLQKRSTDASLHTQLAQRYVGDLLRMLEDEQVTQEFELAMSSYLEGSRAVPFLAYVANDMPDTDAKRQRLKVALFLQGSPIFDIAAVRNDLTKKSDILAFECAILDGKLGQHRAALATLATTLRDASSAEAYCSLNGIVIPPRLASAVAERAGLQAWAALVNGPKPASRRATLRAPSEKERRDEAAEDDQKRKLLQILMEVYMNDGTTATEQTARLLNAQSLHLDVVDVVSAVPSTWPVSKLSSFLSRSLRRTLHAHHEGMIVKAIAAGQNLEATDAHFSHVLALGALIEESEPVEGESIAKEVILEKLAEKAAGIAEPHEFREDDLS
ncbi:hypothetical protein EXIGLDRAFT_718145 [Exidia glandulosa HHB12029]|uniref:CNH domain-containing protein n=1 Tax=Exidia glandulosa HHB12029 TaxID=1314781 RepID=A0A165HZU2_EXIGL|nr:hypothetical protein EXIGLDRAFT_718145 [Exidia glandulosa HHB12029]